MDYQTRVTAVSGLLVALDDDEEDLLKGKSDRDLFYQGDFDIVDDLQNDEELILL